MRIITQWNNLTRKMVPTTEGFQFETGQVATQFYWGSLSQEKLGQMNFWGPLQPGLFHGSVILWYKLGQVHTACRATASSKEIRRTRPCLYRFPSLPPRGHLARDAPAPAVGLAFGSRSAALFSGSVCRAVTAGPSINCTKFSRKRTKFTSERQVNWLIEPVRKTVSKQRIHFLYHWHICKIA